MESLDEITADKAACAHRLVAEYGDRLYETAIRLCGNESDAGDYVFRIAWGQALRGLGKGSVTFGRKILVLFGFCKSVFYRKTAGGCRTFCRRLKPPSGRHSKNG